VIQTFGSKWMISAVARIYQPGCKVDHVLVLEGDQGPGKSTALQILGGPYFTDDIAELGSKDSALSTIGAWIIEVSELAAMSRPEMARTKSFITRSTDRFRPPYGKRLIESPRQCVFAGTVNHAEYLRDETGGRRFWPALCGRIDLDALRRDRDQLWAEAVVRYRSGEPWWIEEPNLNAAATQEQEARYQRDPWEEPIAEWLVGKTSVSTTDVLQRALAKPKDQWSHTDQIRIGTILKRLKWHSKRPRSGSSRRRVYYPPPDLDPDPPFQCSTAGQSS
jgi:predicted P-loop ATPase